MYTILFSGGLDSTVCLALLKPFVRNLTALFFRYGQTNVERELEQVYRICTHLNVPLATMELSFMQQLAMSQLMNQSDSMPISPNWIPLRNVLFITVGSMYAIKNGMTNVVIGATRATSDPTWVPTPDCTPEFLSKMEIAVNEALGREFHINIIAPFAEVTKAHIIKLAKIIPGCWDLISFTHSCYLNRDKPCGECEACHSRKIAFEEAGISDPIV